MTKSQPCVPAPPSAFAIRTRSFFEEGEKAASLRLPFPKGLLARKLGLAPEALSRAFSTLKTVVVTVRGRAIAISNVDVLRQV